VRRRPRWSFTRAYSSATQAKKASVCGPQVELAERLDLGVRPIAPRTIEVEDALDPQHGLARDGVLGRDGALPELAAAVRPAADLVPLAEVGRLVVLGRRALLGGVKRKSKVLLASACT
jgi:hypothetical protein